MKREKSQQKIVKVAVELIGSRSEGYRYTEIKAEVHAQYPDIPLNTIGGVIPKLEEHTDQVKRVERGLFRHISYLEKINGQEETDTEHSIEPIKTVEQRQYKEEEFYVAFADWLENDMQECSKAIPLGGTVIKTKWSTPDVIGIREFRSFIQLPTEVISAEIKIDTNQILTGFGQACSYKLFSHRTYLVLPHDMPDEDKLRIDSLCRVNNIGLIFFNKNDPHNTIRSRANKNEPDTYYIDEIMNINKIRNSRLFR